MARDWTRAGVTVRRKQRPCLRAALLSHTLLTNPVLAIGAAASAALLIPSSAFAYAVGDTIINPETGASLIVVEVLAHGVVTEGNLFVLTSVSVGDSFPDPSDPDITVEVASVITNGTTGEVEKVVFTDAREYNVVSALPVGAPGAPAATLTLGGGASDQNFVQDIRRGAGGDDGGAGALFVSADPGEPGETGPTITLDVPAGHADITTSTAGLPGIIAASIGGNGGEGGNGYLGADGESGGSGGAGGTVILTSHVATIVTIGDGSHGVVGQSRSGVGGEGGSGFLFSSGGSGGSGNDGGSVTVTSHSAITTSGDGSHGVFAQSLGGGAGVGGGSYGLFGDGGSGNNGGDGGSAEAVNYGDIVTLGTGSYGVSAQSVGGIGGDAGPAVGLVTFTDDGAAGGNGGTAIVRAMAGSTVRTEGLGSHGLFAQSIGGGGGNGGFSAGLVSLGSGGGTGGDGGTAAVFAELDSSVWTLGDSAHGLFAQSIGGGGGNGGLTIGLAAFGARGESGGVGGDITVESGASIRTDGDEARGIFAQSVGGGGGSALGTGGLVALGGSGGGAGQAGNVAVTTLAGSAITTFGRGSDGLLAQSIGGGGGTGSTGGGLVSLGGDGGAGGDAGSVTVANAATIETSGAYSRGIFAQSVGGGGGSGGDGYGLATLGGQGAAASRGGEVTVENTGDITTRGNQASAIQAQSLGGGGGDGGSTGGVFLTIGGGGGGGGTSDGVVVTNRGDLQTQGDDSHGIFAQSVGGGGGNGGSSVSVSAFVGVAIGGDGGDGGNGGDVDIAFEAPSPGSTDVASIVTSGDRARGLFAQSVGGGGGSGGFAAQVSVGYGIGASIALGGNGGGGGTGGHVGVTGNVDIETSGESAEGLLAQSVGGGGGAGGFSLAIAGAAATGGAAAFAVSLGGSGGDGGDAGSVFMDAGGSVTTHGAFSTGLLAQSVGGGGGSGGFSLALSAAASGGAAGSFSVGIGGNGGDGGDGGDVDASYSGDITTEGEQAIGAVIQSIGGGGGTGGFNVSGAVSLASSGSVSSSVGLGGSGGGGGDAGAVQGSVFGDVTTTGLGAGGLLVQSAGGGGGAGGFNVSGSVGLSAGPTGALGFGLGGAGGDGGDGASVGGRFEGNIATSGDDAYGVIYQSIGGGGGAGGFNVTGNVALSGGTGSGTLGAGIGGFGGGGGNAGAVAASVIGDFVTLGDDAHGILLQSIGGGGGSGGFNITGGLSASLGTSGSAGFGLGGFGGDGGGAGSVDGTLAGDVRTYADNAFGAMLQSVGGSGGNGGFNVTGSVSFSSTSSLSGAVGLGVGGFGGGGGDAGAVSGQITGLYQTSGDNADGVIAQSLGGGGGNGGVNIAGAVALGTGTAAGFGIGVGGFGGGGGDGGEVMLTRIGDTYTDGANSDAIIAQSVGGGGGAGGLSIAGALSASPQGGGAVSLGLGGFGGAGGDGGDVDLTVRGNVYAAGAESASIDADVTVTEPGGTTTTVSSIGRVLANGSNGVIAQSIGGGGGTGGTNISGAVALSTGTSTSRGLGLGVGGFGGGGGSAGDVVLSVTPPDTASDLIEIVGFGDSRSAVIAQSIGGGGGAGGTNISGTITMNGSITAGVGGFGADGGLGGDVDATVHANLFASGTWSRGLMVQSVGGGGGHGGINVSGGINAGAVSNRDSSLVFGLGGSGGAGNASGDVTVDQSGQIWVDGENSIGLLAQSVAGGGGSGGMNVAASLNLAGDFAGANPLKGYAIAGGIGGSAGTGADAGNVSVSSQGNIIVNGMLGTNPVTGESELVETDYVDRSNGILVQSIGGGGGTGGFNFTGVAAPNANPIAVGVGGDGGAGGDGGNAHLFRADTSVASVLGSAGFVRTFGAGSSGVVVQSVGGGGGMGGINATFAATARSSTAGVSRPVAGIFNIGGDGAAAGDGGAVSVFHFGDILTHGSKSHGLVGQSVGGGGGSATYNIGLGLVSEAHSVTFGVGGGTGAGGKGGTVNIEHVGNIATLGDSSIGLFAQSVGGGGGDTGTDTIVPLFNKASIDVIIGRQGGDGGQSGDVNVDFSGSIETYGFESTGILAQSIAGGGGLSSATTAAFAGSSGTGAAERSFAFNFGVGIDGGVGAEAGDVSVEATGQDSLIATLGERAHGIHGQSIGGGGGLGGTLVTPLDSSDYSVNFNLAGSGGVAGKAGSVDIVHEGRIDTRGLGANGIFAQSVGGGGGQAGGVINIGLPFLGATDTSAARTTGSATISLGATGGSGNVGGRVGVINSGVITTQGDEAIGIRAQSIGGGGGLGSSIVNLRAESKSNSTDFDVNVGGDGGDGGAGGLVDVLNTGLIFTEGRAAAGISATSIGGGGGQAGFIVDAAIGVTFAKPRTNSHRVSLNFGGNGGSGGVGGDVRVENRAIDGVDDSGVIVTRGADAYGIFAQSLGGGGGNGASIISLTSQAATGSSATLGLNLGGSGGDGGLGGDVTVVNSGLVDTTGDGAHGIFAQSLGGGGGNGGLALTGSVSIGSGLSTPLVSVGGFGGEGGDGGDVFVENSGSIYTRGDGAHGILAQSIGGGGGNAGAALSASGNLATLLASNTLAGVLGATAATGSGGDGGTVTVDHSGDITVLGEGSQAIRAESINGGGGSLVLNFDGLAGLGGVLFDTVLGLPIPANRDSEELNPMIVARAGGDGASGTNAGRVSVNTSGTFAAGGDHGSAYSVQSIGGGGGFSMIVAELGPAASPDVSAAAQSSGKRPVQADPEGARTSVSSSAPVSVSMTLGGTDGVGNHGGDLVSAHAGEIVTTGFASPALLVSSIGGGGGRGVIDIDASGGGQLGTIDVYIGAENGLSEHGGSVQHTQLGAAMSGGEFSPAIMMQSVGGGGGLAATIVSAPDQSQHRLRAALGAHGGSDLDGGDVRGDFAGGIATSADYALGLVAQSVGAGGGALFGSGSAAAGFQLGGTDGAQGDGGDITVTNVGPLVTAGDHAHGVFLQSIGGGGGLILSDAEEVSFARSDDNEGDGGDISLSQMGDIATLGDWAVGIVAQSLGGGGGWLEGRYAGVAGGAGFGGSIDLDVGGQLIVAGDNSTGLFAQSAGGSGAESLTLNLADDIVLYGEDSIGIFARSESSDGAAGLITADLDGGVYALGHGSTGLDLSSSGATHAGDLRVTVAENVVMSGDRSTGVVAVSEAASSSGAIDLAFNGDVFAMGEDSIAVQAESLAGSGAGDISISLAGDLRGGSGNGVGIVTEGGSLNEIASSASISSVSGTAIRGGTGGERVTTTGLIVGNVDLGSGDNRILIEEGAQFIAFNEIDLGGAAFGGSTTDGSSTFTNRGQLDMGLSAPRWPIDLLNGDVFGNLDASGDPQSNLLYGARVINTVDLDGNFVQAPSGHMNFDVAFGPYASDLVALTGQAAVDGTGDIILTWLQDDNPVTLFAATGGGVDNGIEFTDTLAIDFSALADSAGIHLAIETDFGQEYLNANGRALGRHMDSAVDVGGSDGVGRLLAMLGNLRSGDEEFYEQVFTELNPEAHIAPLQAHYALARSFSGDLFSCRAADSRDGACTWASIELSDARRTASVEAFGVDRDGLSIRAGYENALNSRWALAASLGYENLHNISVDSGRARMSAAGLQFGAGLRGALNPTVEVGASFSAGWQRVKSQRVQTVFETGLGEAEYDTGFARTEAFARRSFESGRVFAQPGVRVGVTALHAGAFAEEGLAGLGARGERNTEVYADLSPEVTVGFIAHEGENSSAVLTATAAIIFQADDQLVRPLSLVGANPAADPARIATAMGEDAIRVDLGFEAHSSDRLSVSFGYTGNFGNEVEQQRVGLNFRARF